MKKQMFIVALAFAMSAPVAWAQPEKIGADPAQADRRAGAGRPVGVENAGALSLQGDAARRRHVGEDLRPLFQDARQRETVLRAKRHRPVRCRAHQARRRHQQRKPDAAVRHLQHLPAALHRAHGVCARTDQGQVRLQHRRNLPARPRKGGLAEERGRGARPVAQARQERLAAPEAGRQGRQGDPRDARQALRQLPDPHAQAEQRGRVPDVHERVRHVDRAAHQLPRPALGGKLRHRDAPVARRHRRGAAVARRIHRDPRDRAGQPGRPVGQAEGGRPHRRRGAGRYAGVHRSAGLAHRRRRRS